MERLLGTEKERSLLEEVRVLVRTALAEPQRRVVGRYFFQHMTEREIARELGVSRQVVNQHLYGAARGGHRVGGAIAKLRKLARRLGLGWSAARSLLASVFVAATIRDGRILWQRS
jgi:hypothetical protein